MDDRRLAAACTRTAADAAVPIEDALVGAARRLIAEHEAGGITAAGISELDQLLQELRGFDALGVRIGQ